MAAVDDCNVSTWQTKFMGSTNKYFGYVESVEAAIALVKQYELETSTTFSVIKALKDFGFRDPFTEPRKVFYKTELIAFDGIPFNIIGLKVYDCEHGPDRKTAMKTKYAQQKIEDYASKKRRSSPDTIKLDCPARIHLSEVVKFTNYKVKINTTQYKRVMSAKLKADIKAGKQPQFERRIYIHLPDEAEHKGHVIGEKSSNKRKRKKQAAEEVDSEIMVKRCLSDSSDHPASTSLPEDIVKSLLHGSDLTPNEFFTEYWEKKPLIISRNEPAIADEYSQLFSLAILKRILTENDLKFEQDLSACRYVNGHRENMNSEGVVKVKQLEKLVSKKSATIQFHQPQRFQDILWKICSYLECYFQCLVGANVYITPGGSQGLAPHYDDVEVFILQLEGQKHWRLYELPAEERLPRDYSRDLNPASLDKPIHDFVLKAGDLMYFPRGTIHQADTPKHCPHSTHITISTYQHNTWGDLFKQSLPSVVDQMMNEKIALRTGLPIRPGQPFDVTKHKAHITVLMKMLAEGFNSSALQDAHIDFIANRLPPYHCTPEELQSSGPIPTLHHSVRFRFPEYLSIVEMTNEEDDDDEEEDDDEDDEEDEDEDKDGTKYVYLYHSLQNKRRQHMMSADETQPTGLKFRHDHLQALQKLSQADRDVGIAAKNLDLPETDKQSMLLSLWLEGLLEVVTS